MFHLYFSLKKKTFTASDIVYDPRNGLFQSYVSDNAPPVPGSVFKSLIVYAKRV